MTSSASARGAVQYADRAEAVAENAARRAAARHYTDWRTLERASLRVARLYDHSAQAWSVAADGLEEAGSWSLGWARRKSEVEAVYARDYRGIRFLYSRVVTGSEYADRNQPATFDEALRELKTYRPFGDVRLRGDHLRARAADHRVMLHVRGPHPELARLADIVRGRS